MKEQVWVHTPANPDGEQDICDLCKQPVPADQGAFVQIGSFPILVACENHQSITGPVLPYSEELYHGSVTDSSGSNIIRVSGKEN